MKKLLFILFLTFFAINIFSQNSYYVQFKDKNGTEFSLKYPQSFLSQKAIQRRANQQIALDSTDLPVSKKYLDLLKNYQAEVVFTSKWLNGATILLYDNDTLQIENIKKLQFVDYVQLTKRVPPPPPEEEEEDFPPSGGFRGTDSGELKGATLEEVTGGCSTIPQHKMLGLDSLHAVGFRGKGILIAVVDAGFPSVNEMTAFDNIRPRIFDTYNFVDNNDNVYYRSSHGTLVLSTIGANMTDFIGSAPDASFLLYISEDTETETLRETDNWVAAAERADYMGADIITTSLGYSVFNDENDNFTYSDMDGKTTRISRAAEIAAQKGMLVLNSAGNEGNKSWKYITAPADAESVMTIGSVDSLQNRSDFSSMGFSGVIIKPTICTQGTLTTLVNTNDEIVKGSGTSFSAPVAAGMAASIWSAFPNIKSFELMEKIIQSSTNYNNPDTLCGYGIPNVWKIYQNLKKTERYFTENRVYFAQIKFNSLFIQSSQLNDYTFYLCDVLGRTIISGSGNGNATFYLPILSKGIYILKIFDKTLVKPQTIKLIY